MRSVSAIIACLILPAGFLHSKQASPEQGGRQRKIEYQSLTGTLKSVDLEKGWFVIVQKLKEGERDVLFRVTGKTIVFWSRTKMKVEIGDLKPGVRIIVQFHRKGKDLVAIKIVLPGGMKEAAKAILKGNVKGGDKKE